MTPTTRTARIGPTYFWAAFMFAAFVLLAVFFFRFGWKPQTYDDKRAAARFETKAALEKANEEKLMHYKMLDAAKGTVQIPIRRAMELEVAALKAKTPKASAVKVDKPYPFPFPVVAPSPAGGASPAPGASPSPGASPATKAAIAPATTGAAAASPAPVSTPAASPKP